MSAERGRPLTKAEECLLSWARIHQEPDSGVGWRAVFRSWIEMLDSGSLGSIEHAAARLQGVKDLVDQGIDMSRAVLEAIEDGRDS